MVTRRVMLLFTPSQFPGRDHPAFSQSLIQDYQGLSLVKALTPPYQEWEFLVISTIRIINNI